MQDFQDLKCGVPKLINLNSLLHCDNDRIERIQTITRKKPSLAKYKTGTSGWRILFISSWPYALIMLYNSVGTKF